MQPPQPPPDRKDEQYEADYYKYAHYVDNGDKLPSSPENFKWGPLNNRREEIWSNVMEELNPLLLSYSRFKKLSWILKWIFGITCGVSLLAFLALINDDNEQLRTIFIILFF